MRTRYVHCSYSPILKPILTWGRNAFVGTHLRCPMPASRPRPPSLHSLRLRPRQPGSRAVHKVSNISNMYVITRYAYMDMWQYEINESWDIIIIIIIIVYKLLLIIWYTHTSLISIINSYIRKASYYILRSSLNHYL